MTSSVDGIDCKEQWESHSTQTPLWLTVACVTMCVLLKPHIFHMAVITAPGSYSGQVTILIDVLILLW